MVDAVASDYQGDVVFLALAGKSTPEKSVVAAGELFSDRLVWGYDDSIWDLYGNPYQPHTMLITSDDKIASQLFGPQPEDVIRGAIDDLLALHA